MTIFMFFAAALLLTGNLATADEGIKGLELEKALVGRWGNSNDGGKTIWGVDEYHVNGTITAEGKVPETGELFRMAGRYVIKNSHSCVTMTATTNPRLLRIGEHFCVDVLSIDRQTARMRHLETGKVITLYRVVDTRERWR